MDAKLDIDALTKSIKAFVLAQVAEQAAKKSPQPVWKHTAKYKEDAAYADKLRTAARERFHTLSKEERDQINQRSNERYINDPHYREKKKQRAKEWLARLREERRAARAAAAALKS
jgi:hypothetical protein